MARGGKLDINIDSVRLINGDKAALRAVQVLAGGGHTGAMTGAMISQPVWWCGRQHRSFSSCKAKM